jgi:uncharacterized membrane protein/glutaredoxin
MLTTNSNIINVAFKYLEELKVPVTKTSLKENLQNNPYYPSLYSLSTVFERFNINNEAYKIDPEKFSEIQPPFIAYLNNQPTGKDFVLVTDISNTEIKYVAGGNKIKSVTKDNFLKNWENIVLIAAPNNKSGERDYALNHKKEIVQTNKKNSLVGGASLIFISIVYTFLAKLPSAQIIVASTLLIIKTLGLTISVLLLIYEIDKSNSFIKSMCTAGKQTNCNAVLQSKGAKVFGMSWSEAGFFYFAASLLFLLFPGILFTTKICLLSIANCLAAPYILFSIYYQWKVVKQWCPLCLTVQAILAMELVWSIGNYWSNAYFPSSVSVSLLPIACSISFPIVLWYSVKLFVIRAKDGPAYKAAYKRLLYNPETFNSILQQQPAAPDGYQHIGITMGNPEAEITIIKVCSPYCGPCAKAHRVLENIIHDKKNVKVKLIFTASNQANDRAGIIAKHLLAIDAKQDTQQTQQSLDHWYLADNKDYNAFAARYPMNGELKHQEAQIEKMEKWCDEAEIRGTPTLFINGHRLPEKYTVDELKYIL